MKLTSLMILLSILSVIDPPSTKVIQKSSGTPTEGRSVTLTCDITGGRPRDVIKRVTWKKDGKEFTFSGQISITGRDLTISSFGHSKDDGSYTCAAENAAGMGGSGDAFQLNVLCKYSLHLKSFILFRYCWYSAK